MSATDYLMVLPVPHFRVGRCRVAVESAFAEHLRMMRRKIGDAGEQIGCCVSSDGDGGLREQEARPVDN